MRIAFLFLFISLFSIVSMGQDKKMSTMDRLKELAKAKKELDEKKKTEWDAYVVRVEADNLAKKQKKTVDSIEKSKRPDNLQKDFEGFTNCKNQTLPFYKIKNQTTNAEEEIAFRDYIKQHIISQFKYPAFARDHDLEGRVIVNFYIDKDGNPQIHEANGPKYGLVLEEEAIRIIQSLPKAIPASCDGKSINIMFAIPIMFQLEE